jgi:hypothetical protein
MVSAVTGRRFEPAKLTLQGWVPVRPVPDNAFVQRTPKVGGTGRIRTYDNLINSQVL